MWSEDPREPSRFLSKHRANAERQADTGAQHGLGMNGEKLESSFDRLKLAHSTYLLNTNISN